MGIADNLNPIQQAGKPIPFDGQWRVTQVIGCPAAPLHIALGCPTGSGFSPRTLALFYEGNLHEADLRARMYQAGYAIEAVEIAVVPGLPLVAHPDDFLQPGALIEYKSYGGKEYSDAEKFLEDHRQYVLQGMFYAHITGRHIIYFVIKHRDSGWIIDAQLTYDPDVVKPYIENVLNIKRLVDMGVTTCHGPSRPQCSSDFLTRMFCPFQEHCQFSIQQASGELETKLKEYAAAKIVSDELLLDIEDYRVLIRDLMQSMGIKAAQVDEGVKAVLRMGNYSSIPINEAAKVLDKPTLDRVIRRTRIPDQLIITIDKSLRRSSP